MLKTVVNDGINRQGAAESAIRKRIVGTRNYTEKIYTKKSISDKAETTKGTGEQCLRRTHHTEGKGR